MLLKKSGIHINGATGPPPLTNYDNFLGADVASGANILRETYFSLLNNYVKK
jgi:hypothetical protein